MLAPKLFAKCMLLLLAIPNCLALAQPQTEPPELLPAAEPSPVPTEIAEPPPVRLPREHHCWCHLEPGAWRTLRVTTETFDPGGQSLGVSVTSETETLSDVQDGHYALQSKSVVEIGGKKLSGPDRVHQLQLLTDTADEAVRAVPQPPAQINLDGRAIPCSVWRLTVRRSERQLVHEVYYNDAIWPFVLRREVVETSTQDSTNPLSTTRESVVRSNVPVALDEKIVSGAHLHSVTETPAGRTERLEVHSASVPGGLVSRSTTEWDAQGHRIRWGTTELVEFGEAEKERRPLRRLLRRNRDR
ncbi:MAG: hypothetical protein WD851_15015 [Pirellulales bacterium]